MTGSSDTYPNITLFEVSELLQFVKMYINPNNNQITPIDHYELVVVRE